MDIFYSRIAGKPNIEPLARVYLFEGKEDAQKQEALAKLTAQVLDAGSEAFDLEIYEGKELTAGRLLTAASLLPFTSSKRLVIVRRANAIATEEQEAIARKLGELPESAVVVLLVPSPELNKQGKPRAGSQVSSKLTKAVASAGVVVKFPPLRPDDAVRAIGLKIAAHGKKIDGQALRKLVDRVGSDLAILETEAQKLVDYTGDRSTITLQDVELVSGETPEERIWKMLDAVGARNTAVALRLLKEILESGAGVERESPRTLAMILRQLRLIWQVRSLMDDGLRLQQAVERDPEGLPSDNSVIALCRRQPFQVSRLQEQARNFSLEDLEQCFEYTAATDMMMKGIEGEIEDTATAMELLVINLCRRQRTTQTRGNR